VPAIGKLTGYRGSVYSAAFSSDGLRLASAGADGAVRRWDVESRTAVGAPLGRHNGAVASLAFEGDIVASGSAASDTTVCLWKPWRSAHPKAELPEWG
jgi:WD40 repeat protein